jgi:hypothetical protein
MKPDNPETMTLDEPTVWQETALHGGSASASARTVQIGRADLEAAVHGGVITTRQAMALWLRWSDPGKAASMASGPGQRPMPLHETGGARSGPGRRLVYLVGGLVVVAVLAWVFGGALRF